MCIFAYMFSQILVYSFLYSVACLWGNYFNVKSVCKHHFEIQHILNFAFVSSLNKEQQCDIRGRPLSKVYLNVIDGQIDMRAFITLPTNLCKLCLSYEDLLLWREFLLETGGILNMRLSSAGMSNIKLQSQALMGFDILWENIIPV